MKFKKINISGVGIFMVALFASMAGRIDWTLGVMIMLYLIDLELTFDE